MEIQPLDYEDLQIKVPWGFIAGRWYGNRKVRPILALHGWQDNLGTWTPLLPLLPRHIGILCVDFPGHGRSSRYPKGITYHVLDYVHTILSVIKEYKWKKVSLMGHSLGAVVSYLYATIYPETIDLLIQIDIVATLRRAPDFQLKRFANFNEKLLIENERYDDPTEPPSRSFDQLVDLLHRGSGGSVNKENCKYLIERSCTRSAKDPEKLYFSRDPRVKFYMEYTTQYDRRVEMTKPIRNINFLVIKGSKSTYVPSEYLKLMEMIAEQNPHFEFHELEGTHHLHLNSPKEVAAVIAPFICKHRPAETIENERNEIPNMICKL